ncbi:recombination directionality factor [Streptomyces cyaneofuscatus]|uniref:recombination directionality factor n=1 Tax=Streptomyces cyaneofuscatus TaxID=66883 RepID=UPI00363890FC
MAGLRIFETDPDAKPVEREEYERPEFAFQLRTGTQVKDSKSKKLKPVSLARWRVLAQGPDNAGAIAELLGGEAVEFGATKEHDFEVLTTSEAIEIVLSGPDAIEEKLIQWGTNGQPIHECDGVYSLLPDDRGELCGCPPTLKERKAKYRKGQGPGPGIVVTLRLAGHGYELGLGRWIATSWQFAEVVHTVKEALDQVDGEALARLEIVPKEFTTDDGELVKYKMPVITVLGSYSDAVAEEA